ncbi:MAG: sodium-dependent bicarbonate transport family permease [Verrucomicrobiota bacterium]
MELVFQNLISPITLSFVLGMIACWIRSDLEIPGALYQGLSIYLLFAIGLKGGSAVSETPIGDLIGPAIATLMLGFLTPFSAFWLLKSFGGLSRLDAAAAAAHYGSVSAVTFLAALEAAKAAGFEPEGYLAALVAILEVPGIIVGLMLAQNLRGGGIKEAVHEVLTGKSILLLVGAMTIGAVCGAQKVDGVAPFFIDPFKGVLCLFLLELGIVAARRMKDIRDAGWKVILSGCILPLVHGVIGVFAGIMSGMSPGGAAVLGAMVGSASYIAAPAAVRIALPQASPGIYLTMALGVTFPFNLAVGIPVLITLAPWFESLLR